MLRYILLGFLDYAPSTGYELKRLMEESTSNFWHAHHTQIYVTLRRLEADGLLTSALDEGENKLEKRVYTLTDAGRAALRAWLDTPLTELPQNKDDLMVRVFFSAPRERGSVLAELRLQRRLHQGTLERYAAVEPDAYAAQMAALAGRDFALDAEFWRLTVEHGRQYEAMYIAWLDAAIARLESLLIKPSSD